MLFELYILMVGHSICYALLFVIPDCYLGCDKKREDDPYYTPFGWVEGNGERKGGTRGE